ncbi:hypothetical protein DFH06DRAFT_997241, partial [Mycena polygramma]
MKDRTKKDILDICSACKQSLKKHVQPLDALANFQYYAIDELPQDVKNAFAKASLYDLMMVARSRCTRITHMFSEKRDFKDNWQASQGYSKGNVAIFPQDCASVRPLLPPPRSEINEAMCALFIGPKTAPTRENIKDLKPVLVSKTRVQTMLDFLLTKNSHYAGSDVQFSQENLDDLFPEVVDVAFPTAVEICCLPDVTPAGSESYADRGDQTAVAPSASTVHVEVDDGTLVLDAVGYTVGERTPLAQRNMKGNALAWCLDRKNFVKMQTGSIFVTDRDPGLLTNTFPALDP